MVTPHHIPPPPPAPSHESRLEEARIQARLIISKAEELCWDYVSLCRTPEELRHAHDLYTYLTMAKRTFLPDFSQLEKMHKDVFLVARRASTLELFAEVMEDWVKREAKPGGLLHRRLPNVAGDPVQPQGTGDANAA